jgi:hypothetical protein
MRRHDFLSRITASVMVRRLCAPACRPWIVVLLLGMVPAAAPALAADSGMTCPPFQMPLRGQAVWVAPDMRLNGVPMQIKRLTTDDSPQQLIDFYKNRWGREPQRYHEYTVGDWQAIATVQSDCFYTVQAKVENGGTVALLGVSSPPSGSSQSPPGAGFPALSGSDVLNDIDNLDGPKTARTVVLTNAFAPAINLKFYRDALGRGGWTTLMDRAVDTAKGTAYVMVLKHGMREANITITQGAGGSMVLATIVNNP